MLSRVLFIVMLNVILPSIVFYFFLNVIILSAVMLQVGMLNVVMLNVVILSVLGPIVVILNVSTPSRLQYRAEPWLCQLVLGVAKFSFISKNCFRKKIVLKS